MNTLTLALNKLMAAYELIADATHELADATHELADYPCDEKSKMGYVASLTWLGGDLATVIRELEKEGEE